MGVPRIPNFKPLRNEVLG